MTKLSAQQKDALEYIEAIAEDLGRWEAETEVLRDRRVQYMRKAIEDGIPKSKVAAAAGIHRSRLYALLTD